MSIVVPKAKPARPASQSQSDAGPRTSFTTKLAADFFTAKGLTTLTGYPPTRWLDVVVKELVDNSLDACEEAGLEPVVDIVVDKDTISIADNGPGIPSATIAAACDYSVRKSSRAAYQAPDRGAQGNALKTILAMGYVLTGRPGSVSILTGGLRHVIAAALDPISEEPIVTYQLHEELRQRAGTVVSVEWPFGAADRKNDDKIDKKDGPILLAQGNQSSDVKQRILPIIQDFAALNPHLSISLTWDGESLYAGRSIAPKWPKWRPSDPSSIHWYSVERFGSLIAKEVGHERDSNLARQTVRDFISQFDGLRSTVKRKAVLAATDLAGVPLESLVFPKIDQPRISKLHKELLAAVAEVKPARLGILGRDNLRQRFVDLGIEGGNFQYRKVMGNGDGKPYVVEVAFAHHGETLDAERRLIVGINWSPCLLDPFRELSPDGDSLESVLREARVYAFSPVLLFVHVAFPSPNFTDKGKSAVALPPELGLEIANAVRRVTKTWTKQIKCEERNSSARLRRAQSLVRSRRIDVKEAAHDVMERAFLHAATSEHGRLLTVSPRQIMYAARPYILRVTGSTVLDSRYFTQTLLPDFINDHPDLTHNWDIVWDARGSLIEPHTRKVVPLGTLAVRQYLADNARATAGEEGVEETRPPFPTFGPKHRYSCIVLIEKEGFWQLLSNARLGERYDVALMSTKGQSTTACRTLIDKLGVPVFIVRDFDVAGFSIAAAVRRDNRRYKFRSKVKAIDLGLRLEDVKKHSLQKEAVAEKNIDATRARLARDGATPDEIEFLCDGHRVELNAFTSRQFLSWIEGKLEQYGVAKVVPDAATLSIAWRTAAQLRYVDHHSRAILQQGIELAKSVVIPADLRRQVKKLVAENPAKSWDVAINEILDAYQSNTSIMGGS